MQKLLELKKLFLKERLTKDIIGLLDKELFYLECNPEVCDKILESYKKMKAKGIKTTNPSNSMVLYVLGLADKKPGSPIKRTQTTLPDIDYDTDARDQIKSYLVTKYGQDNVSLLGTYNTLKVKGAIKDVVRQIRPEMSFDDVNKVTKKFDLLKRTDFESEIEFYQATLDSDPELRLWFDQNKEIAEAVVQLIGNAKSTGIHAGGIIVSSKDIKKIVPLSYERNEGIWVTQPEMADVEGAGLIKYDFLGLNTLKDLNKCIKLINERHGKGITISNVPLDDKEVFAEFTKGNTVSVFQFNTPLATGILTKLRSVDSINDLAQITSIARPGPLNMGMDQTFIKRKNGIEKITYLHQKLEPHLKETYGIFCIAEGQNVLTKTGQKKIEEVSVGDYVKTEDGSWQRVSAAVNNGEKQTVKIRLSYGEELICTPDHKVFTQDGWKEAGGLTKKDIVKYFWVMPDMTNEIEVGDDKDWILGLALADGNLCNDTPEISCGSEHFAIKVKEIAETAFGLGNVSIKRRNNCWTVRLAHSKRGKTQIKNNGYTINPLMKLIRELKLENMDCYKKRFPEKYSLSTIAGFIEGDGCISNGRIRLKNKDLAYSIYLALQSARIHSSFFVDKEGVFNVSFHDYEDKLPLRIKERVKTKKNYFKNMVPRKLIMDKKGFKKENNRLYQHIKKTKIPSVSKALAIEFGINFSSDEQWSRVLSVTSFEKKTVYDLSVENVHSFVVGGHVVHNCYQEQVMSSVVDLGGFSPNDSVVVLKAMGKKQKDKLVKFKQKFINNCVYNKSISQREATEIWEYIESFAEYGFNKSHAISYAILSYLCAWMKLYYPLEWVASVLSNASKDDFKIMYQHWDKYLQKPDVVLSKDTYCIDDLAKKVVMPLSGVNGVGDSALEAIIKGQPYSSFDDFYSRIEKRKVNKGIIINLIFAGCFDKFKPVDVSENKFRKDLVKTFIDLKHKAKKPPKQEREADAELIREVDLMTRGRILMKEIELLNFTSFDYHSYYKDKMTDLAKSMFGKEAKKPNEILNLKDKTEVVIGGAVESIEYKPIKTGKYMGKERAIIRFTNQGGAVEVIIFPWVLEQDDKAGGNLRKIKDLTPMIIKGTVSIWNGNFSVIFKEGIQLA